MVGCQRVTQGADGEGTLPSLPCSNEWVSLSPSTPSLPSSLCRAQKCLGFGPSSLPLQVVAWGGQGWWRCLIWEVAGQCTSPGPAARSHPLAPCPAHRKEAGGPSAGCPPARDPTQAGPWRLRAVWWQGPLASTCSFEPAKAGSAGQMGRLVTLLMMVWRKAEDHDAGVGWTQGVSRAALQGGSGACPSTSEVYR